MDKKIKNNLAPVIIVIVIAVAGFIWWYQANQPGKFDDFAKCLKDKGAVFYGAFWCSHCQSQKSFFKSSAKHLNYIECSTPDGKNQLKVCNDAKIKGYPTWEFADGSRREGELSLKELSDKTGCSLPH